jgi:hypothetical protein
MTCVALGLVQSIANKQNKGKEENTRDQKEKSENDFEKYEMT